MQAESFRRTSALAGGVLAVVGLFMVAAAYGVEARRDPSDYDCGSSPCPGSDFREFIFIDAGEFRLIGVAAVLLGFALAIAGYALTDEESFTRVDEEAFIDRMETASRRLD